VTRLSLEDSWRAYPTPTDKVTAHSYLPVYDALLRDRRDEPLEFVEVGVREGGSLMLWRRCFPNARITGIDIAELPQVEGCRVLKGDSRDAAWVATQFTPGSIDVLIDDGDHSLEAQAETFLAFAPAMKKGGLYFIEDVYPFENVEPLLAVVATRPRLFFDLRDRKGRIDDVLIAIRF
jgi:hypothetical protein